ncbi:extracellular solute-binding protein [Paenibacillus sp. Y412MC10]|uniref:extracellular solute-binding protein n=1 Tax=Geobacillus sp. (strain Y412MC10) TaxID=481743 RepID=UPI0011AB47EE|nr:extracellular solute-binding protein [Paenibacillus sp. Y412MC10]
MRVKPRLFFQIFICMVLVSLSACGRSAGSSRDEAGGQNSKGTPERAEISIMTITPSTPPASDDNVIKREIEKLTDSKLDIQWISNNVYDDKLNITLVSGELPDLTYISDPFGPSFRNLVKQGAIWDITPYLKDYPNLQKGVPEVAWELTKMEDGKNYGIPRGRDANDVSFLILRKDWLDKLDLQPPKTTEELYGVLKAFAEKDPDGNGKADTFGLSAGIDTLTGTFREIFTGVTGSWKEEGDGLTYAPFLPEARESLAYLAKLYSEKLLPEDLLTLKTTQVRDYYIGNRAGGVIDKTGTGPKVYAPGLKKLVPSYKEADFYPLAALNGFVPKGTGFNGILAIPKTVPENKLKQILKLVDTWLTPEVSAVQRFGIEGIHYRVENGVKIVDPDKLLKDNASDFNQIVNSIDPALNPPPANPELKELEDLRSQVDANRSKENVPDIGVGLYSPAAEKLLPDLEKRISDLTAKIVIGQEPLSAWDDLVAKTKSDPQFIQATKEMSDAYRKRNGH